MPHRNLSSENHQSNNCEWNGKIYDKLTWVPSWRKTNKNGYVNVEFQKSSQSNQFKTNIFEMYRYIHTLSIEPYVIITHTTRKILNSIVKSPTEKKMYYYRPKWNTNRLKRSVERLQFSRKWNEFHELWSVTRV